MTELTPELLAQLEQDAAWFSPDENPYRLGIEGERTIDGEEEDVDEMTIYGVMDDGASHEIATFHVDDMAPHAVRIFAALPALVSATKERDQLRAELDQLREDRERYLSSELHRRYPAMVDELAGARQLAIEAVRLAGDAETERDQLRDRLKNQRGTISKLREEIAESADDESMELAACSKQLDVYAEERAKMIAERDRAKQEIADIRGALDAHGHDGTFEAAAKLRDEAAKLRAEVERLRNLGRNACILARSGTGRDRAKDILAEIERKP